MSDEPSTPPDLSAIDLSLSFAPSWAKEGDSAQRISKLAEKHGGGEDRPQRGKGRGDWQDRSSRPERRPPRREGGDRPPRRDGGRDSRRDERRPEREARPAPAPALNGWNVTFMPDRHGMDGLAKQIKASAKAYPLFDLARLVLEKSERYLVEFKRTSDSATALFQLKSDGSLWLTEGEAVAHALATQLDKFYRRERVSVDPPKGVYPFVAVCGMSGTLLGPPNYHDYQTKLIKLHAERFANMPFEAFKSRIRMERDESFIEKWKEEQSARDVFHPIDPNQPQPPQAAPEAEAPAPEPAAEEAAPAPEAVENADEIAASDPVAGPPATEAAAEPAAEESAPGAPDEAAEPVVEESAPAEDSITLASLAEVERHFREHHAAKVVVRIRERVVAPGPAALNESSPGVLAVTRGAWEELNSFPLPLAHNLGQQLTSKGLQIFKTRENITYVGVARPHHLDITATPVSDALRGMLEYIEAHPAVPRAEQWRALVAMRPLAPDQTESQLESAVASDLFWLLREGHVIDYAKRGLEAARKPKPPAAKPPKKQPAPQKAVAEPKVAETPVAETPVAIESDETPEPAGL
jgi:hypothetical protein